MELGALVCTARSPQLRGRARSPSAAPGARPAHRHTAGPAPGAQRFAGTDRQVRGLLLDVLRGADGPVDQAALDMVWPEPVQRERALDALIVDGLVDAQPDGRYALPGEPVGKMA